MALKKIPGVVVEPLVLETYLAVIESSVGTPLFRTFWANVNGKRMNIVRDGRVSCSFYTSSILKLFNLVSEVQVTITRLKKDMKESGWKQIPRARKGAVVFWSALPADTSRMKKDAGVYQPLVSHCGFVVSATEAVHNDGDKTMAPIRAQLRYRPIESFWWHPALEKGFKNPGKPAPKRKPGIHWHPNK
jgi:hypothetical protein